jgi:type II secretory pathway component PulJ
MKHFNKALTITGFTLATILVAYGFISILAIITTELIKTF